jgi:RimJ/RimL family protein N-acetyltransferase
MHHPVSAWWPRSGTGCAQAPGGLGYATEGARALAQRAFTELGVSQIVATTMAIYIESRRVLERLG